MANENQTVEQEIAEDIRLTMREASEYWENFYYNDIEEPDGKESFIAQTVDILSNEVDAEYKVTVIVEKL